MKNRQQEIIRTGYIGIGTNVFVAAGKAVIGSLSGSIAITLDAVNNISDALSSVITIIGVKLAGRPANDKHPFGYGRIEYFTAIIIATMILVAGVTSLIESIKGILEPSEQDYTLIGLCIITATIIIKFILGLYTKRKGKELSSEALQSSGSDSMFDSIISLATVIAAIIMITTGISVDCWLAAIISCIIIKAGIEMLMSPINELLGRSNDPELINSIKKSVGEINNVRGVYDIVMHNYGPEQNIGALHVEVDDTLTASDLHHITRQIQTKVRHEFGIFTTVGFYAHHQEGSMEAKHEALVREKVTSTNGVIGMHGFYINHNDKQISFDIVYSFKVAQPITIRTQIAQWLKDKYPDYDINIGLDRKYDA